MEFYQNWHIASTVWVPDARQVIFRSDSKWLPSGEIYDFLGSREHVDEDFSDTAQCNFIKVGTWPALYGSLMHIESFSDLIQKGRLGVKCKTFWGLENVWTGFSGTNQWNFIKIGTWPAPYWSLIHIN